MQRRRLVYSVTCLVALGLISYRLFNPAIISTTTTIGALILSEANLRSTLQHYPIAVDILVISSKANRRRKFGDEKSVDANEINHNIIYMLVVQVEVWIDPSHNLWHASLHRVFNAF
jgi:hypothetical protein